MYFQFWSLCGLRRSVIILAALTCLAGPRTSLRADAVRILHDDWDAVMARVALIQQARSEIDIACFAVGDDQLTRALLALLGDASRRGVQVRLVVDGLENDIPDAIQLSLIRDGVEIREFHPIRVGHPCWLNRRMHDKVMVADRCHAIVGSRNLDERNFGLGKRNYVDRDAYLQGEAAAEAHRYFHCLWSSNEVRPVNPKGRARHRDLCRFTPQDEKRQGPLISGRAALNQGLCDLTTPGCFLYERCQCAESMPIRLASVCFLHDDCGRKKQSNAISEQILGLIAGARESIILESPYLVVSHALDRALEQAESQGAQVVILTNSLCSTDQMLVYAGYSNQKKKLLVRGVELWEFAGPNHLHAKSALIDGCISIIGSYNFDPRSEHLNTEAAIVSRDAAVADDLLDSLADHFANAWQVGADGKPVNGEVAHPGAEKSKIRQLRRARLVASLIKRQL
jgi:phosphatidylserine/phosphatidylglycerophosphate/cardiolipin synthase-like enzyme